VLVVAGSATGGLWLANLHNGLLAPAFTVVGAYVLFQRPGHRVGQLFLAAGLVEAVLFFGRQVGREPDGGAWWGWLGVWPVAVGIALCTLAVLVFPDGRLPSPGWRPVAAGVVAVAAVCAGLSALWPVEYEAAGVATAHPFGLAGTGAVAPVWEAVAHTAYPLFQVLWVVAVVLRWRRSGRLVRVQLAWVGLAAGVSAAFLLAGMAAWQSPRAGLLSAFLVPLAAGWAVVHGRQLTTYSALTWLSRTGGGPEDLPADLARAVAEALDAPAAAIWMGDAGALHAVGVWPPGTDLAPADLGSLTGTVRPVTVGGEVIGAVTVAPSPGGPPGLAGQRLLDDLAAQAGLVIGHLTLVREQARRRATDDLDHLSPRERQVLELMARGLSNAAICRELHLSIKTVEPVISAIFTKLGLGQDTTTNRRVLAVLAFLGPGRSEGVP
jgi:DNA-binding CsgD family transcriptional regulator